MEADDDDCDDCDSSIDAVAPGCEHTMSELVPCTAQRTEAEGAQGTVVSTAHHSKVAADKLISIRAFN